MLNIGVLNVGFLGLVVGVIIDINRLATHEGLIGFVLECLVDRLDLLVLGAAV